MSAAALAPMAPPRRCYTVPRVSIHALGQMDDQALADMAAHGENGRVRVAALLVLIGRQTAVPEHAPWDMTDATPHDHRRTA